jgi:hypothetical protein
MSIWDDTVGRAWNSAKNKFGEFVGDRGANEFRGTDESGFVQNQSGRAADFANQGEKDYGRRGGQIDENVALLQALARGEQSFSAEQLRQAAQANVRQQMAMAASGRGNPASAARTAAQNASGINTGLAGQQALAGIAERNAATGQLGGLLLGARGQDLSAVQGGRGQALQGGLGLEGINAQKFGALLGVPTTGEQFIGAATGAGQLMAASDRRLKKDISDGSADADRLIAALTPSSFKRKTLGLESDPAPAKRDMRELGIMAQNIENTPAGDAVVNKDANGMRRIDIPALATSLAAGVGRLGERLKRLESGNRESPTQRFHSTIAEANRRESNPNEMSFSLPETMMRRRPSPVGMAAVEPSNDMNFTLRDVAEYLRQKQAMANRQSPGYLGGDEEEMMQ